MHTPEGKRSEAAVPKCWNSLWRAKNLVYGFRRENRRKTRHDDALRARPANNFDESFDDAGRRFDRRATYQQQAARRYRRLLAVSVSSDQSWRA
jgi:hypothetical protein